MEPLNWPEPPFRCGTAASRASIARLLGLPAPEPWDQDWEICSADGARTDELVTIYQRSPGLTADEQLTLMEVIVASFDDWLGNGGAEQPLASRIGEVLGREFDHHACTVFYWCQWDRGPTPPVDHVFAVTRIMREIWMQHR